MTHLQPVDEAFVADLRARSTTPSERSVTSMALCAEAGITYRMCDWWTRTGRLQPTGIATPGTGAVRRYPAGEARIARLVRRLMDAGVGIDPAFTAARALDDDTVRLGPGLVLLVEEAP